MDVVRRIFAKQAKNRNKKDKVSTYTPTERCKPPRTNTGGGGLLRRKIEVPIALVRANYWLYKRIF